MFPEKKIEKKEQVDEKDIKKSLSYMPRDFQFTSQEYFIRSC
jgi:hypothetical protein